MSAHAKFSPSGAHRWIPCPGSLALEAAYPNTSSKFADEGTAAHEVAAKVLQDNLASAVDLVGTTVLIGGGTFVVDSDMAAFVDVYVNAIRQRIEAFKLQGALSVEMYIEHKVDFSSRIGVPDSFGTADCILVVTWRGFEMGRG